MGRWVKVLATALGASTFSACGAFGVGGGSGPTIALLLPETKTARYETHDRPEFERAVAARCGGCRVLYANADQDAGVQLAEAEAALANGARVIVLDPVDARAASGIAARAHVARVPVVSYDRLVRDADVAYYVSFDNERVGELQARALLARLGRPAPGRGSVVMLNGSPTDTNAAAFKRGAHRAFDGSGWPVGAEFDTPDWSPDRAEAEMEQAVTRLGRERVAGVYAANDGMAGGALAGMTGAGFATVPPVTGQDAELAAVQRVVAGEQFMTVYKATRPETEAAATLAVALATRSAVPAGVVNGRVDNGHREVPSVLLAPVAITRDNVATVMVDGFWSAEEVCTGRYKVACRAAGVR